jgi:voltage-gated potassium channel Kch
MKRSSSTIIFGISGVFALIAGGSLAALVYVIDTDANALAEQSAALALREAEEKERLDTVRLLDDTFEERTELKKHVLTESGIITFITDLETIAKQQALEFTTQTITPIVTPDPLFDQLAIEFIFTGRPEQVTFLLELLETLPYHSTIQTVSVRQASPERSSANVSLVVTTLTP